MFIFLYIYLGFVGILAFLASCKVVKVPSSAVSIVFGLGFYFSDIQFTNGPIKHPSAMTHP